MPEFKLPEWAKFDEGDALFKKFEELRNKWLEREPIDFGEWIKNVRNLHEKFSTDKGPVSLDISCNYLYNFADNVGFLSNLDQNSNDQLKNDGQSDTSSNKFLIT